MRRVSIRTLVLMLELLGFFLAYQCLVFIPPAKAPARTCAVRPDSKPGKPPETSPSDRPAVTTVSSPKDIADWTAALRRTVETRPSWHSATAADPNDRVEPGDGGPTSDEVE